MDMKNPKKPNPHAVHFSSNDETWMTPPEVLEALYSLVGGRFDLDPCSNSKDPEVANVKADVHYTKEDDGLSKPWHGTVFMNPPYGRGIVNWVAKASNEVEKGNAELVIGLIPSRTDTHWWHQYVVGRADILFFRGRIKFVGATNSAPFPSALVVWHQGLVVVRNMFLNP